jgi:transposase InsO family protein
MSSGRSYKKKGEPGQGDGGERWGCLIQDRSSRFVAACTCGPLSEDLIAEAIEMAVQRTHRRPLNWFSDGWMGYQELLRKAYRQQVKTPGKPGRALVLWFPRP